MSCQKCGSLRVAKVGCKCSDMFFAEIGEADYNGYVPEDLGIGDGDYVRMSYCLDCGQIQGKFPLPQTEMEDVDLDKWARSGLDSDGSPID